MGQSRKTTVSGPVREAVRDYLGKPDDRIKAMQTLVGIRKERPESVDAVEYVRGLRRGGRLERLRRK